MTTRHALGRHRATPVRSNPLESISKAVSSNAGSVGRQAAVIAAASGLVLSIGVPAQATPATREANKAPAADVLHADLAAAITPSTVKVPAAKKAESKIQVAVADLKSTDGSDYRAAQQAKREAVAERQAAAEQAAAEQAQARRAAAEQAEARQAADRRQVTSTTRAASSTSNDGAEGAAMTRENRGSTQSSASSAPAPTSTTKPEPKPVEKSVASSNLGGIAGMAASFKGAPYVWGGSTPGGWDCSGFVQYIYGKAGISLPHNTTAIRTSGKFVKTSSPKLGDLVYQNGGSHVGIYIGGGKIVGAQNPSVGTVERPADSPYGPLMGYYTYVG